MEKFIPYKKLSKKKKREQDKSRRTIWAISPVTRRPENPKAYKRKKIQDRNDDSDPVFLYIITQRTISEQIIFSFFHRIIDAELLKGYI